ncbi:MAG TPA: SufE family protein [Rhodothermales bacterium]|nr:SufE family protein [Rhodothermales bacterium]
MNTIADKEQDIIDEFSMFEDWMGKYEYLIELGRELPLIEDAYKTEEYKIHGCQAQVWLRAETENGTIRYKADSDAIITKGLIALLVRVLSGQPPEAITHAKLDFLDEVGLKEHLSPTRKNGLGAMVKQMKMYALALTETATN